jgi:hypothetical protein
MSSAMRSSPFSSLGTLRRRRTDASLLQPDTPTARSASSPWGVQRLPHHRRVSPNCASRRRDVATVLQRLVARHAFFTRVSQSRVRRRRLNPRPPIVHEFRAEGLCWIGACAMLPSFLSFANRLLVKMNSIRRPPE